MVEFWKTKWKIAYQGEMLQQEGIGLLYRKNIQVTRAIVRLIGISPHTKFLKGINCICTPRLIHVKNDVMALRAK